MPFNYNESIELSKPIEKNSTLRFTFDNSIGSEYLKDLTEKRNKLASRLERFIDGPTLGGHPILKMVFNTIPIDTVDEEELRTLAKALEKIADLVEPAKALDAKVKGLMFAQQNANTLAMAFADISHEVDTLIVDTNYQELLKSADDDI